VSEEEGGDPAHSVIAAEHRHLSSLFAEARTALEKEGDAQRARVALARLRDGMETHFQREESLYYPTLWALRPDLKDSLAGLVETHPQFRERLEAITGALRVASFAEAGRSLEELVDLFSDHERAEELLLQSLDAELIASA
jgi:hemerythrin